MCLAPANSKVNSPFYNLTTGCARDHERLRVAYVIHSMRIGGAERSIARLINALDHQQFAPLVICMTRTGPAAEWIESSDVPIIEINRRGNLDRSAFRRLSCTLIEHRVSILHSHNWGSLLESFLAGRFAGVGVHVHAERGSVLGEANMHGLRMRLRGVVAGWAMRRCDAVVTNAHSVALRIEQRCGYAAARVRVIPNGVEIPSVCLPPQEIAEHRTRIGLSSRAVLIGSVGRLVPVKGFDLAIQAVSALVGQGVDCHLMLVGDGPQREELEKLAASHQLANRVHFMGHQDDVGHWLSLIDIYINSSYSEGMSQSLVEAMAAGRPVIATDVGDSSKVVGTTADCGRLVSAGSVGAIVDAIKDVLANVQLRQLGCNAARRHCKLFSTPAMASRYEALYRELLPSGSASQFSCKTKSSP